MGDVMDKKSCCINVSKYSAVQTVKYSLAAKPSKALKKQKSVQLLHRQDRLKTPVLTNLIKEIRNAKNTYNEIRK